MWSVVLDEAIVLCDVALLHLPPPPRYLQSPLMMIPRIWTIFTVLGIRIGFGYTMNLIP